MDATIATLISWLLWALNPLIVLVNDLVGLLIDGVMSVLGVSLGTLLPDWVTGFLTDCSNIIQIFFDKDIFIPCFAGWVAVYFLRSMAAVLRGVFSLMRTLAAMFSII